MVELFLNKIWDYVKPHAVPVVLVVVSSFVLYSLLGKGRDDSLNALKNQQQIHDAELKKIEKAQEIERKQHEENLKKLESSLEDIRKSYDDRIKTLEEKKAKQIGQMVQKYDDDPTGVARQIGDMTGFRVVSVEK
jgi:hypothetical protein